MKILYTKRLANLLASLIFLLCFYLNADSQGNLLITPKRILFEGSNRSQILNLSNTGSDTATYVISVIQIRMKEDGTFEQIVEPDSAQLFSDKNIRFFPRRVTLAPNEAQTVKVQMTKKDQLVAGEYRSHLYLRAVHDRELPGKAALNQDSGISVSIIPVFGISIPVIIRVGESDTKVNFTDVHVDMVDNFSPSVKMTLNRTGNMSVYGDVSVDYISLQGKVTQVGLTRGVALYTPNTLRHFQIMLEKKSEVDYHTGKLRLTYSDQSKKLTRIAEEVVSLN